MLAAQAHATAHGGELVRWPGGYWIGAGLPFSRSGYFGTSTVHALVMRGVATYTERSSNGAFPIRVRVDA